MIERAAVATALELKAHPHMLRHACGYALANKGHDTRAIQAWLGHRLITSTAVCLLGAQGAGGLTAITFRRGTYRDFGRLGRQLWFNQDIVA